MSLTFFELSVLDRIDVFSNIWIDEVVSPPVNAWQKRTHSSFTFCDALVMSLI